VGPHQLRYFNNPNQNSQYAKDIIPGEYEGGFKLWDCTVDLASYLAEHQPMFQSKRVLELGCGHGLLGILAHKLGASEVCLQDYNQDVIQQLTKQTVALNCDQGTPFSYLCGDWTALKCTEQPFDIILGSELIYNEHNYSKLLACIQEFMAPSGVALLANKIYYFGVGGSMAGFRKAVEQRKLTCESLLRIVPTSGGNKKEIVKLTY
jgi:2-polyprenyl-3-methyl-5-hydroxy-6-metoxy-1,4-benzoquinol methylase